MIRISQTKKSNLNRFGFSLIEIMIILVIIGTITVIGARKFANPNREIKSTVRKLGGISRELHAKAKLRGLTYRLAIEMNIDDPDRYWIEVSSSKVVFLTKEKEEEFRKKQEEKRKDNDGEYTPGGGFQMDKSLSNRGITTLPSAINIKEIEYGRTDEIIDGGIAYIHFLPQGLVEEAAIHIEALETLKWTITFHPITGKLDIFTSDIALKDIREQ